MASGRYPFEVSGSMADLLRASDSLRGPFEDVHGTASVAKLFRDHAAETTRLAILSAGKDMRSAAVDLAYGLQDRIGSTVDGYLAAERNRMVAMAGTGASSVQSLLAAARENAFDAAIRELASATGNVAAFGRMKVAEYAWDLLHSHLFAQRASSGLVDYLAAEEQASASLLNQFYDRYPSLPEYSADSFDFVGEPESAHADGEDAEELSRLNATRAQSRTIETAVAEIVASPNSFWDGKSKEYRNNVLMLYMALIFGLMDQFRWHLDTVAKQRDAAASAKEQAVLAERHKEVMEASERLSKALEIVVDQALEKEVYVVMSRPASVRSLPGAGWVLGIAHPNQEVLVTGKSARWLKVRFRDHLEQREVEGWILKHYLQPLKSPSHQLVAGGDGAQR